MKMKVFSVIDLKAQTYMPPFFMHNEKLAERAFGDAANNGEHMFCAHPEDYALYCLGEWDDETGKMENYDTPESLGLAIQYIQQKKEVTSNAN
jgi:hypothetical protein